MIAHVVPRPGSAVSGVIGLSYEQSSKRTYSNYTDYSGSAEEPDTSSSGPSPACPPPLMSAVDVDGSSPDGQ